MEVWWPTWLGIVAGLCTTVSFVPQVLKAWREGDTAAISKRMYLVSLAAYSLWIVHGLMISSLPLLVFNGLNLMFAAVILALKVRGHRSAGIH